MERVLRSLHACFLHDGGRAMDEERFRRMLPALVRQLSGAPPQEVLPALAADAQAEQQQPASAADAAAAQGAPAQGHVYGRAAVEALDEMGVSAGSDTFWKTLNHQGRALSVDDPSGTGKAVLSSLMLAYVRAEKGEGSSIQDDRTDRPTTVDALQTWPSLCTALNMPQG